jgi:NADPH:quinone reductase
MTAAVGLYARLGLPEPYAKVHAAREPAKAGVIVYGAASAVGAFVIKLLVKADVHPILAVAGNGIGFVEGFLDKSKGDVVVDYRKGDEEVVKGLKAAAKGDVLFAYDAGKSLRRSFCVVQGPRHSQKLTALRTVSEKGSYQNICQVLSQKGGAAITLVLPGKKYDEIPSSITQSITTVGSVHGQPDDLALLGFAWYRLFGQGLREGWFSGHPHEVVAGGLGGVVEGLNNLKDGKASAVKYVYRVAETEGISASKI